jgi:hypothetical protein
VQVADEPDEEDVEDDDDEDEVDVPVFEPDVDVGAGAGAAGGAAAGAAGGGAVSAAGGVGSVGACDCVVSLPSSVVEEPTAHASSSDAHRLTTMTTALLRSSQTKADLRGRRPNSVARGARQRVRCDDTRSSRT